MTLKVTQICLNEHPDGALRYMSTLSNALSDLKIEHTNIASPKTTRWLQANQESTNTSRFIASTFDHLYDKLPSNESCLFIHGNLPNHIVSSIREKHFLVIFAHNPAIDNIPHTYRAANSIITVSKYVSRTLKSHGFNNVIDPPLYGISSASSIKQHSLTAQPVPAPVINWDKSKIRDLLLSHLETHNIYSVVKQNNMLDNKIDCKIKLGIVSRLARLKRFPELLTQLSHILDSHPSVCLHIFGSGSYREVKNIVNATNSFKDRTFFWGWQDHPYAAYKYIDYLLLGRPEHEALGLNVLEAQTLGLKVIAINDGPFPETVNNDGWLYDDPKYDNGVSFNTLIESIIELDNNSSLKKNHHYNVNFTYKFFVSTLHIILSKITIDFNRWQHTRQ